MEIASAQLKVFTKAALETIGIAQCNATLLRWEKRGAFPRRFYLSPKCPVWRASEVSAFLAARQAAAEPNEATAQATIAAQTPEAQAARRETRAKNTRLRAATRTRRRQAETITT